MHTLHEAAIIPKYPFEPDALVGNPLFRINRNDNVRNYQRSDFLVPHRKDYYFLVFVKKGSSRHWIDMTPYTLQPNTFYFTVPQQVHLKEESEPLTGTSISFSRDFLAADNSHSLKELPIIRNPHNGHVLLLNDADIVFIEDLLHKLYTEYHSKNEWQHPMLLAYMRVLLIYLSRLYTEQFSNAEPSQSRLLLRNYLLQVEKGYKELHEVAAYADALHISAGHLSEVVKEQSGKPAIAHIHERLLLEAKRLLLHSDISIKEMAYQLGFEDASYFNRFFKRLAGQTPMQYREAIRKMYH